MLQDGSIFSESPLSFNSYSCDNFAEIAAKVCEEFADDRLQLGLEPEENEHKTPGEMVEEEEKDDLLLEEEEEIEEEEDEFEFCFLSGGDGMGISGADEIFANGQIRPVFPIFNRDLLFAGGKDYYNEESKQPKKINSSLRKLFIGERREEEEDAHSASSSEAEDGLDNLPAGTYCVWKPRPTTISSPSPDTCKKSKSTGSSSSSSSVTRTGFVSKRWRLRDLLFRSNSDGKNTFVFLTPPPLSTSTTKLKNRKEEEKLEKVVVSGEVVGKGKLKTGEVSAHEIHYVRNRALKENDRKKSYLPYKQDLVGFFSNA